MVSVTDAGTYGALSGSVSWGHGGTGYGDYYSYGNVNSSWSDTVTLQPGTYDMTMIFDSTATWSYGVQCDNGGGAGSAGEGAQFYAPGIYGGGYGIGGSNGSPCNYYNQNPIAAGSSPTDQVITGSFTVTQVTTTLLGGSLSLSAGVPEEAGTGSVSSSGSVLFYLNGVTSGATYTSASGTDYETPSGIPEPASFALTGCALILLARRRKQPLHGL